ncbi:TetR family transcriptional regulator [Streptomyces sp. NPDC088350]|uniref:TetR family transcriptional regulator n=1 Tax=Streptomyces sp. NPDC088350 TaxID=3365854 RepID=UPI00382A069D
MAEGGRGHVSLDRVAAFAGVGKSTAFRRFGNRAGLLQALLEERSREPRDAVGNGPPPLGPGAPAPERLLASTDAFVRLKLYRHEPAQQFQRFTRVSILISD